MAKIQQMWFIRMGGVFFIPAFHTELLKLDCPWSKKTFFCKFFRIVSDFHQSDRCSDFVNYYESRTFKKDKKTTFSGWQISNHNI